MAIKIIIYGNVHGIFFRTLIEETANKLGIKGYVKNTEEGVEVLAEGNEDSLNKLIEICKKGPSGANIGTVKVSKTEDTGSETFEIMY